MDTNTNLPPKLPNVQIFQEVSTQKGFKKLISEWIINFRVIYVILVVVVLVEVFLGAKTLLSPIPKIAKLQSLGEGQIILQTDKSNIAVGETFPVRVKLSTAGHTTVGTDIVLNYDPQALEFAPTPYVAGSIYSDYLGFNNDANSGVVLLSGVMSPGEEGFNGTEEFATFNMVAKKAGKTSLRVDFKDSSTSDTNITDITSAKDILGSVYNLELNVGGSENTFVDQSNDENSCEGYTQMCWDNEGKQGTQECMGGKMKENVCSFDPILTNTCEICQTDS